MLAKVLFKLEILGLENLPPRGPYMICVNHQSYLDGILIFSALPYRTLRHLFSVGHSPYFERGFKKLIAILTKIVPIDPDSHLVRAMRVSAAGLKANKILLIFPEGNRTYDGHLQTFKKGAAILATELHVPVLPVAIEGSFEAWSKVSDRIRFLPIKITIGKPLYLEIPETSQDYEQAYTRSAEKLRDEVSKLISHRSSFKGETAAEPHKPAAHQAEL